MTTDALIQNINEKLYNAYWLKTEKLSPQERLQFYMTVIDQAVREVNIPIKRRSVYAHPDAKGKKCEQCCKTIHKGNAVSYQHAKGVEKPKYYHVICIKNNERM